jgi:hypothetical protein
MPKRGEKKVLANGNCISPPSASAANKRSASASSVTRVFQLSESQEKTEKGHKVERLSEPGLECPFGDPRRKLCRWSCIRGDLLKGEHFRDKVQFASDAHHNVSPQAY